MPFRYANSSGGYDFPAFPSGGDFDFINYDAGADPLMSPYDTFSLANPPEVAWTPNSDTSGPQHSDSFSPLNPSPATRSTASPRDVTHGDSPAVQQVSLGGAVAAPPLNPLRNSTFLSRLPTDQQISSTQDTQSQSDHRQFQPTVPQAWERSDLAITQATAPPVMNPLIISAPEPIRQSSTDSNSDTSDAGRGKAERSEASRIRTTDSAKVRHNIVERRYRENINAQVDVLRDSIVATMQAKDEQNGTSSSRLGADELKRLTKAAVIAAATQQIKRARSENDKLLDEHRSLQAQIKELESMVKCGDCPLMQLSVDLSLESPNAPSRMST